MNAVDVKINNHACSPNLQSFLKYVIGRRNEEAIWP
jgi:hypothetical protein